MAPHVHGPVPPHDSIERVRHRLLSDLHLGKLAPGDRVPSVRRLADQTGLNRKTVHRAYARLAEEGLLEPRPGSGTFVADGFDHGPGSIAQMLDVARTWEANSRSVGLPPDRMIRFLECFHGDALRGLPLVVTECNLEQSGLIARDLARVFGSPVETVPLALLRRRRDRLAGRPVVTTDCHHAEVVACLRGASARVYRVAFDLGFPRMVADAAGRGTVAMVVSDPNFGPVFRRLLRSIRVPRDVADRVRIMSAAEAAERPEVLAGADAVHVSPLVDGCRIGFLGRGRPVRSAWALDEDSRDRLRTSLSLDLALDRVRPGA